MKEAHWTNDWAAFVRSICRSWDAGLSAAEVTQQHSGRRAQWEGVVIEVREYYGTANIAVRMADITFQLNDGRRGTANYIALKVDAAHVDEWRAVKEGDRIVFETEIEMPSADDPFTVAGIEWANMGNNKGYISISTRNSRLLDTIVEHGLKAT